MKKLILVLSIILCSSLLFKTAAVTADVQTERIKNQKLHEVLTKRSEQFQSIVEKTTSFPTKKIKKADTDDILKRLNRELEQIEKLRQKAAKELAAKRRKNAAVLLGHSVLEALLGIYNDSACVDQETAARRLQLLINTGLLTEEEIEALNEIISTLPEDCPNIAIKPLPFPQPTIINCPTVLHVGERYTLIGEAFETAGGNIKIKLDNGLVIDANIISWSDTAVTFELDASLGGIPFSAPGRLSLARGSGPPTNRQRSQDVEVIIEPLYRIYTCDTNWGKSCFHIACTGISQDVPLYSSSLPSSYKIVDTYYTPNGIALYWSNFGSFEDANIYVRSDPEYIASTNKLKVVIHVGDEFIYDIYVSIRFFISIPNGIPVPSGWATS